VRVTEHAPRAHEQRELVQEAADHRADDGKSVPLVRVPSHLRLDGVGRARQPDEVLVDERVDDVHVALHDGAKVAQMAAV